MPNSLSRRIMIVMTIAAVALGGIALPAAAKGGPKARDGQTAEAPNKGKGKGNAGARQAEASARKAAGQARKAEAQARREARFRAVGFITAVDSTGITLDVKKGKKALRDLGTATVTVADGAKVKLNGERVTLDALAVGDRVKVKGAKVGDAYVAKKVIASRQVDEDIEGDAEESTEGDDTTTPTDDTTTPTDDTTTPTDDTTTPTE